LAYILLGSLVKISFHGVQIDIPSPKDLVMLKMTIQMMYHKYVSKKKRIRSMTYIIVSVNGTWLEHNELPKIRSEQPCTLVRAITAIGLLKDEVKKKYDSVNLQPKTKTQSMIDAVRALRGKAGYDAVKV